MAKLSKEFMESVPSSAEILNPAMVGKVISYAGQRTAKRRNFQTGAEEDNHILCVKLDGVADVEIQAGAFNSLFFGATALDGNIDADLITNIDKNSTSVTEAVASQPKWTGAAKGQTGIEKSASGEGEFGTYMIAGCRIKTRNGVPTLRSAAYKGYEAMIAEIEASEDENARINYNKLVATGVKPSLKEGTFKDLISYEYLLVPTK